MPGDEQNHVKSIPKDLTIDNSDDSYKRSLLSSSIVKLTLSNVYSWSANGSSIEIPSALSELQLDQEPTSSELSPDSDFSNGSGRFIDSTSQLIMIL